MKRWTVNVLALVVAVVGATRLAAQGDREDYMVCMEFCVVEFGLSFEYCHSECRLVADAS